MVGKEIKISCDVQNTLPVDEIIDFQEDLKYRTTHDIELIIKSIEKYGFSFPFFIWQSGKKNYCLDGHGRLQALKVMVEMGYTIPDVPVYYIYAKSKAEAKNKLLRLNSAYGQMTKESVLEFIGNINVDFDELQLPNNIITFTEQEIPEDNKDIDETALAETKNECPKCGFKW